MFSQIFRILIALIMLTTTNMGAFTVPTVTQDKPLAEKSYSLADRYNNTFVNDVFSDNILLTLAYLKGTVKEGQQVNWSKVKQNYTYTLVLQPGQTFAFHDSVLPEYKNASLTTTNAHFDTSEGFKSDGWLVGDGVCHLASFMNMVARAARLHVESPTPHDFASIPDVPKQYGVAIYDDPEDPASSSLQNLYITNTLHKPIAFVFTHKGSILDIRVEKQG